MKDIVSRYLRNAHERTAVFSVASFGLNALFGATKLVMGVYLFSAWFIINAVYYLILCVAKGRVLKEYKVVKEMERGHARYDKEFGIYKQSGIFICLLGVSYLLVCLRMWFIGDATVYGGLTVYFIATVAFSKMGSAIYGLIKYRHMRDPIISCLKMINITDAFVSIVVTQCTLLAMADIADAAQLSAIAGLIFSTIIIVQGVMMIRKKKKYPIATYNEPTNTPHFDLEDNREDEPPTEEADQPVIHIDSHSKTQMETSI